MAFGANAVCGSQRAQGWQTEGVVSLLRGGLQGTQQFLGVLTNPATLSLRPASGVLASRGRGRSWRTLRAQRPAPDKTLQPSVSASSGSSETRQPPGEQGRRRAASRRSSSTWDAGDWHQGQAPRCVPGQHLEERELSKTWPSDWKATVISRGIETVTK